MQNITKTNGIGNIGKNGAKKTSKRIKIFDTTLRDGEQDARAKPTKDNKITAAQVLDRLGVDVIEAGCLAQTCSTDEKQAVREIVRMKRNGDINAEICVLARSKKDDIDAVIESGAEYVHLYMGTSEIHRSSKFNGKTHSDIIGISVNAVIYAKSHGMHVLFSAEDATRTDVAFLKTIYKAVIDAGADEINIPDTLGCILPINMASIVSEVRSAVDPEIPIHIHSHNDIGMAAASTIAAIQAGADCAQVTVCGIGERTGNAALEQVVAWLHFYSDNSYYTGIDTHQLVPTAKDIAALLRFQIPENTPIIGKNAFTHKAGVHEDAVDKDPKNYECISPEVVGNNRRIIISRMASSNSISRILDRNKVVVSAEEFKLVIETVRKLNGETMDDTSLCAIAEGIKAMQKD